MLHPWGPESLRAHLPEWDNGWNPDDCNMRMHLTTTLTAGVDGAVARHRTPRLRLRVARSMVGATPIDPQQPPRRWPSGGTCRVHPDRFPTRREE